MEINFILLFYFISVRYTYNFNLNVYSSFKCSNLSSIKLINNFDYKKRKNFYKIIYFMHINRNFCIVEFIINIIEKFS